MKKIFIVLCSFLLCSNAYGGTIAIHNASNDSEINLGFLNNNFNIIENVINGGIDTDNIEDDSLTEADFADAINPRVRDGEFFNDFTYTGHLPATDTDLDSDISAGTSYVEGYRVVTTATSHTYTASKDTWVYIDINGTFQYQEVTLGATQPSTPANSLLLAKVTTDATKISSVTDHRTLTVSLGVTEDQFIAGMEIRCDNIDEASVDAGVVYHGSTRIAKTTYTNLALDTASDWWDGVQDNYGSDGFVYIGVDSDGNIKWLGDNPPDKYDTSGNTGGTGSTYFYWYDGSEYWRVLGAIRVENASDTLVPHFQCDDVVMYDIPINVATAVSAAAWSGATDAKIPAISNMGLFGLQVQETLNTSSGLVAIRPNGSEWALDTENTVYVWSDGQNVNRSSGQRWCGTDFSQQIQYANGGGDDDTDVDIEGYKLNIR